MERGVSMNKLLIVEDEKMIRQGIKAMALRSPISIGEIIECKNGEEAFEVLKSTSIDLMITDIRMPKKDGITLVKEMQALPKIPRIVVVSGYDDFSYAVDLLRYGAKEYLLKPIEREKMYSVLEKIDKEIKEEEQKQQELDKVHLKQLKYLILSQSIEEGDARILEDRFENYFLHNKYIVCSTNCTQKNSQDTDFICLEGIEGQSVYIVLKGAEERLTNNLFLNHSVGISREHSTIYELQQAYLEAFQARKIAFATGLSVKRYDETVSSRELPSSQVLQQLIHMVGTDKVSEVTKYLEKALFQTVKGLMQPDEFEHIMKTLVEGICINYRNLLDVKAEEVKALKNIYSFDNSKAYCDKVISWITDIHDNLTNEFDDYKNKQKIQKAILYIQENYSNDLNMAVVSNHIEMNYSLFSHEFKQYTQMNFVNYLKHIRINEAKKLLEETDSKIIDVSLHVGYENEKHFMKTFKSVCGVSPSEYRKNVQVGKGLS
jgi:YesN/AraC family two-component response regulator